MPTQGVTESGDAVSATDAEPPAPEARKPRRRAVLAGAAAAAAVGGWALWTARDGGRAGGGGRGPADAAGPPTAPPEPPTGWKASYLQVIAHPDDDLYFMNPGMVHAFAAGYPLATVVTTSAEGDGRNIDTADKSRTKAPVDNEGYSRARQNGLRRSYSRMVLGRDDGAWLSENLEIVPGFLIQADTLEERPQVRLFFLNLRKCPEYEGYSGPRYNLTRLFAGDSPTQRTLRVAGSTLPEYQEITRAQVVDAMAALIRLVRPTILRTLDPDPEHDNRKTEYTVSDHVDHTAVANFCLEAIRKTADGQDPVVPVVEHYRAYANRYWPRNIDNQELALKGRFLSTYSGEDGQPCPANDCGDYQLGPDPLRSTYVVSTALRYTPNASWMVRDRDGGLAAVAALGDAAVSWYRAPGGDAWAGPTPLAGNGITPGPVVVAGPDGRTHAVGLRRGRDGSRITVELVRSVSPAPGRPFGPWESLGNPEGGNSDDHRRREVGAPAAAVDGHGKLYVFTRNSAQALTWRAEQADGWSGWAVLGGTLLQDMPRALTNAAGGVEVFAPNKKTVKRWFQKGPGDVFQADDGLETGPVASCGFHAITSEDGRPVLFYRQGDTGRVLAYRQSANRRDWPDDPADFGGPLGIGPVSAVWRAHGGAAQALVAVRDGQGGASVSTAARDDKPDWRPLGGPVTGVPAVVADGAGREIAAVLGGDGRLHVATRNANAPDEPFGGWLTV
ncbi:PIG-L family deacetylase [Yinghuangia aomiensis]|uniref:PIG-L family deacetylase n=1 Tax=Yinghuangia aomiensis TaxID=676205 RepID=A0ABP9HSI9_9ACTN